MRGGTASPFSPTLPRDNVESTIEVVNVEMLDVSLIREDPERVGRALEKRDVHVDLRSFLQMDEAFRRISFEVQQTRTERNEISAEIANAQKLGEDVAAIRAKAHKIGDRLAELSGRLTTLQTERKAFLDSLPNLPDDDVVAGGKENNKVIYSRGDKPQFDFAARDHVALAESLNVIDYQRGVKLGGSGFWTYRGEGAKLEWALLNYFIDAHLHDGYEFILPPHILNFEAGYTAGQFPKFADDVFVVEDSAEGPQRFMLPTAETALVNLHRDETLPEADLPRKYFAYSPCYRKEIGGYRSTERGTLRGHQFQKVEMFQFTRPDDSDRAHQELLRKAEQLVADLGLHYRVTQLAAEDLSSAMAKTFDVEVWLPSIETYMEVSSVSNARDYQARRGNIRCRSAQGKVTFVHTLNASGLATSRLTPAILEQFQQADGSVRVPKPLQRLGLGEILKP